MTGPRPPLYQILANFHASRAHFEKFNNRVVGGNFSIKCANFGLKLSSTKFTPNAPRLYSFRSGRPARHFHIRVPPGPRGGGHSLKIRDGWCAATLTPIFKPPVTEWPPFYFSHCSHLMTPIFKILSHLTCLMAPFKKLKCPHWMTPFFSFF